MATVTAAPFAYIDAYPAILCADATGFGGIVDVRHYDLTPGVCQNIQPLFLSFEGGNPPGSCPEGTTATILAYSEELCAGTQISVDTFPADGSPGICQNFGGQSAEVTCV